MSTEGKAKIKKQMRYQPTLSESQQTYTFKGGEKKDTYTHKSFR